MPVPLAERYLKLAEAAELLRVHPRTITRWITNGELTAYKFANSYRIPQAELERFMEKHRTDA